MSVCAPKSGRARCVRATQKTVATHTLKKGFIGRRLQNKNNFKLFELCCEVLFADDAQFNAYELEFHQNANDSAKQEFKLN